jgi:hypothetical protein
MNANERSRGQLAARTDSNQDRTVCKIEFGVGARCLQDFLGDCAAIGEGKMEASAHLR